MSIRKPTPRAAVTLIRAAFTEAQKLGAPLSTKNAYELLAHLEGYKNWAHAKAYLDARSAKATEPLKRVYSKEELKDWDTFVICSDYDDEGEEQLFVLPLDATLENRANSRDSWVPFDDSGRMPMPDFFVSETVAEQEVLRAKSFVVKEIFSSVPRVARYGLPLYANELGAMGWVHEELGWSARGYLDKRGKDCSAIEINFCDTGDDSGGRYWMEVAVTPDITRTLKAAFETFVPDAAATTDN